MGEVCGIDLLMDENDTSSLLGPNRNMYKSKGWTLQGSLLKLWMDENASQQSNKNH